MRKTALLSILLMLITSFLKAQTDTIKEHPKSGYNFGALPIIGFSTDMGVQAGILFNAFNYGNGKIYPKYFQNLYIEFSRTSKGGSINQFFFDSEHIIKGLRFTADFSSLSERALPFYGFNGSQSIYNPLFENDGAAAYVSRMFYRHERKLTRLLVNLQGSLVTPGLKWLCGVEHINFGTNSVNIDVLNKGLNKSKKIPQVDELYDDYVKWGLIDASEKNGGSLNFLLPGIIYDTRDNEPNPSRGIWTEAVMAIAPGGINPEKGFTRLAITHRQYFNIIPRRLIFAYRLNWRQTLTGKTPFYFLPYQLTSSPFNTTIDGLGGVNTIRGILQNRLVADGMALGNAELRFKAWKTYWYRQNIYLAFTSFYDAGIVTKKREMNLALVPQTDRQKYFNEKASGHLTQSAGIGLHIVMNENFNMSLDYGKAFSRVDGNSGLYMDLGYLF